LLAQIRENFTGLIPVFFAFFVLILMG
jgi:hypothetical protein